MGNSPFEHLPPLSSEHFKLYFYAAVLHIMEQASHCFDSFEKMLEEFPFLVEYNNELAGHGLEGLSRDESYGHWHDGLLERVGWALPTISHREPLPARHGGQGPPYG